MHDPLDKAVSRAPATVGEGCLSRYDPDELTDDNGADFDGAEQLWREQHPGSEGSAPADAETDA